MRIPLDVQRFRRAWRKLAEGGCCDNLDSAQYRRVSQEWLIAGRPRPISEFITRRANAGADGKATGA